ncbi:MAG: hypothetical protein QM660_04620 [Dysgonomonas sp.]
MLINDLSVCYATNKVEESKKFYIKYFGTEVTFDCSWYISLKFVGNKREIFISFMVPQDDKPSYIGGTTLNINVINVDEQYARLQNMGLTLSPIEDQPWGDRSFRTIDPLGTILYIYSDREPSDEYKNAYKKKEE